MNYLPDKGYEVLWDLDLAIGQNTPEAQKRLQKTREKLALLERFENPGDLLIEDRMIPGIQNSPEVRIRTYRPISLGDARAPLVIDIHGGGFATGDLEKDNKRCAALARGVPCEVIQVDYRLLPEAFPAQLNDCYAALCWAYENPEELGIDQKKIALFGSSAGGNLVAGLSLYVRDHGGPNICFQILNYAGVENGALRPSALINFQGAPITSGLTCRKATRLYTGADGNPVSYYQVPANCQDLSDLPPTAVIAAEYCPFRDEGIAFAQRLMNFGIPCELYSLPRVPHAYDLVEAPRTRWIQEGICLSLKREFHL